MRPEQFYQPRSNGGAQATSTTKRRARTPRVGTTRQLAVLPSMNQFAPAAYSRYDGDGIVQRPIYDSRTTLDLWECDRCGCTVEGVRL